MIEVELPDGAIAEFPDGTPQETIKGALQKRFAPKAAAPAAEPDLLQKSIDALQGFRDVPNATRQLLARIPAPALDLINKSGTPLGFATQILDVTPETAAGIDTEIQNEESAYQSRREASGETGFDMSRLGGNIVGTAPIAAVLPAATTLSRALLQGGVMGASQPVTNGAEDLWTDKTKQAAIGTIAGGIMNRLAAGLSRVVSPRVSDAVQRLLDEGITPSPGQVIGGAANRAEQKLASVPLIGDAIRWGRNRANQELNEAAINRALAPIGEQLPAGMTGREAVTHAGRVLGDAYDDVLTRMGAVRPDAQFGQELGSLSQLTANLPEAQSGQFQRILQNEVLGRIDNAGVMTSEGMKAAESNLGNIARNYMRSPDYDQRQLGAAVIEAQNTIRQMVQRVKPQFSDELAAINSGWANFMRPQRAASMVGAEDGNFTASQLQSAVKALDPSRNKSAFARGNALMQDLSDSAKNVLGDNVPDSGTAGRLMMAALLGAGADQGYIDPKLAALGIGGAAAYSPVGQQAIAALLTRRPDAAPQLAEALLRLAPAATAGGAAIAPALLK